MANITTNSVIDTLFQIDPTQALIDYVQAIKPYHTKVLETLIEYVYSDPVNVTIKENWSWVMDFSRPDVPVVYTCGYGYRWSPIDVVSPEAISVTKIIQAVGDDSTPSNTFLVTPALYPPSYGIAVPYDCLVINTQSNQLAFVTPFIITSVTPATKTFIVTGSVSLTAGQSIYVNSNTTPVVNGKYTVAVNTVPGPSTTIIVNESIYPLATVSGTVNVIVGFDDAPYWPTGTKVQLSSSGTLPSPLLSSTTYYFIPTETIGVFNLATKRYPQQFEDFIDLTTLGTGTLTAIRVEPFVPGDSVIVNSSYLGTNDGNYIIYSVEPEGLNFRIGVMQKVQRTTPVFVTPYDGTMTLIPASFGSDTYCAVSSAPDLYASTYISELLQFTFELSPQDFVGVQAVEYQQTAGYGNVPFGDSPYDSYVDDFPPFTTITFLSGDPAGTHMILPTGLDTQFFDIGGIDETYSSVSKNYGHTVPLP